MNKMLIIGVLFLASVTSWASSFPTKGGWTFSRVYNLRSDAVKELLLDDVRLANSTVEFDLLPRNSSAQVGVLLRYIDKDNWVYVGCDKATDHFGFAYWYVETPAGKTEIARDIAKLYAHHVRHIKVNCIGKTVTVYVDGEQITHKYIPNLPEEVGQIGFRVHDKGNVQVSNVSCKPISVPDKKREQPKRIHTLSSAQMDVSLNKDFPAVASYRWKKNQAIVAGQPFNVKYILLNGDYYFPKVTSSASANRIVYTLAVKEIGVTLQVAYEVTDNVLHFLVTDIEEKAAFKVKTLAFPDHYLVSMPNSELGASLSIANNVSSDSFVPLQGKTVDSTYQYGSILLLNSDKLVATLESNSIYGTRQFLYQTVQASDGLVTGIWGNEWIYRGHTGEVTALPYIKVILSDDQNNDQKVDWQDGAMALQKVYPQPMGLDMIRNAYATITMNFASCAQYPFLRQLDNIKKFYLATDGFGQMLELKGYQSEGHDSAHPDYSGNYNRRAGGLKDFSLLVKEAKKYNAHIGVHINHSESYPEARAFTDQIVTDMPAWSWLDQAYFINKEADMLAGTFEKRLSQLNEEVPDLSFVYIDTYREYRWLAYQTAKLFTHNNWAIWTEDADVFDKEAIWIHYNPEAASLIHRFVHHQYRDGYAAHPALLGGYNRGAEIGFMGWQKGRDFTGVIRNFFTKQLPYRYLMHYPVMQLDSVRAVLQQGIVSYKEGEQGTVIRKGEQLLMRGGSVFIPWNPITEEKIYHYNTAGGKTTWMLPASWSHLSAVYLYQLGPQGKALTTVLPVHNRQIEIEALPEVGYVVCKAEAAQSQPMEWSTGSGVKDMGFDGKLLDSWTVQGEQTAVSVQRTTYGQDYLSIKGAVPAGVSQEISGLTPGKEYIASVWVQVHGQQEALLTLKINNEETKQVSISESKVVNYTDNTDRFKTTWQRLKIPFRMPSHASGVQLSLTGGVAANDTSSVSFDDVRLVEGVQSQKEGYDYFEDFETTDEGWGPFIACQPSAFTTHLSQKHGVYTQNTIHGEWSLATWRERNGEVYRTSPSLIRFLPQQAYEMVFDYTTDEDQVYRVVGMSPSTKEEVFSYDLNRSGTCRVRFATPSCTDFYIAIVKQGEGMLIIDDFGIKKN